MPKTLVQHEVKKNDLDRDDYTSGEALPREHCRYDEQIDEPSHAPLSNIVRAVSRTFHR